MIDEEERETFVKNRPHAYYIWVVLHEIFGHGTGRFLTESDPGVFNFDHQSPPLNPITGSEISSWYLPGQTWTSVFGDLSTTVDECRAELVGAYLIDDRDIVSLFGFTECGQIKPDDRKILIVSKCQSSLTLSSHIQSISSIGHRRTPSTGELQSRDEGTHSKQSR